MRETIQAYVRAFCCSQNVHLQPELEREVEREIDMGYILENVHSWDNISTENLVKSFALISHELKEELPYYGTIISDDASGRLVSLFFRKIVNEKREELGKEPTSTYFLTPRRGMYKEVNRGIESFLKEKVNPQEKVLIATEHIDSGASLSTMVRSLENQDVEFDIASISINKNFRLPDGLERKVIYASRSKDGLALYNGVFTGVTKNIPEDIGIHPKKRQGEEAQRFLNQARDEIGLIADEVSKVL